MESFWLLSLEQTVQARVTVGRCDGKLLHYLSRHSGDMEQHAVMESGDVRIFARVYVVIIFILSVSLSENFERLCLFIFSISFCTIVFGPVYVTNQ
jgi:hypothetical protein